MRLILALLVLSCCGVPHNGKDGKPCTVVDSANGAVISCPDGTSTTVLDGSDNKITSSFFCTGQLENSGGFWFKYRAAGLASGDVFAYGAIQSYGFDVGGSVFYSAEQVGAATAAVIFTADIAGAADGGWWNMQADRTTRVAVLTYYDADVTGGQTVWTMPASDCQVQSY